MKRTLALLLALALVFSLAACGDTPDPTKPEDQPAAKPTEPATEPPTDPEPTVDPALQEQLNDLIYFADLITSYYYPSRFRFSYNNGTERLELEGMDAMAWVYETAQELAPQFPEAQKIVDGFTVIENQLLAMFSWREDALGNIVDDWTIEYDYYSDGSRKPRERGLDELFRPSNKYGIKADSICKNIYDDNGNLISVRFYSDLNMEKTTCVIEYTYDENGIRISEHYLDTYGTEYNTTYEYDENGLAIRTEDYPCGINASGTAYFTHDDQNRLISVTVEIDYGYQVNKDTTDYVYDEAGNLISVRDYGHWYQSTNPHVPVNYSGVRVWDYEYDETGRCIRHTYTKYTTCDAEGNPVLDYYPIYTVDYIYGTYYIYTPVE